MLDNILPFLYLRKIVSHPMDSSIHFDCIYYYIASLLFQEFKLDISSVNLSSYYPLQAINSLH